MASDSVVNESGSETSEEEDLERGFQIGVGFRSHVASIRVSEF